MGEQSVFPKENNVEDGNNEEMETESDNEIDTDDLSPEEFERLDSTMDELNTVLDALEQKNDDIHAQLLKLLQDNREIRLQLHNKNVQELQQNEGHEQK
ncbi:UPF0184 protein AAEL002161 [Aethina tumida]|uniref:UPF0184 protein AAEL002161 n=1 Tax=Aethina tumida TaxID=116153 RepID=UPI00096ADC68|nr:UPF0184 protein AAEL002161 [Aethina tumida]XP_019871756.1 UPF0184 protein AAEL002161 [Aethina tumida]